MSAQSLILFGKHPAWSDHMSIGGGGELASKLKRQFYDRSVVAATTAGIEPKRFADCLFIFQGEGQTTVLTAVPSQDSVGRRLFPLFAGWVLTGTGVEVSDARLIEGIRSDLEALLQKLLAPSETGETMDQAAVEATCATFAPSARKTEPAPMGADPRDFCQLVRALQDGERALLLPEGAMEKSLALAECACRQFRPRARALLIFDRSDQKQGLFLAGEEEAGFPLNGFFEASLPELRTETWPETGATQKLTGEIESGGEDVAPSFCPILGLSGKTLRLPRKWISRWPWFVLGLIFVIVSVLVGLFFSGDKPADGSAAEQRDNSSPALDATRELWDAASQDYADWVLPLQQFMEEGDTAANLPEELEGVRRALKKPLNPFEIFGNASVSEDRMRNPGKRIFIPENTRILEQRAGNIEELKSAVRTAEARLDVAALKEILRDAGIDTDWLKEATSEEGEAPEVSLSFDENLVRILRERIEEYKDLSGLLDRWKAFESKVLHPLEKQLPEFEVFVREGVQARLSKSGEGVDAYFATLRDGLDAKWLLDPGALDVQALRENEGWAKLFKGEANPETISQHLSFMKNFERIEADRIQELAERLRDAIESLESAKNDAENRFPREQFLAPGEAERLSAIRSQLPEWNDIVAIRKNFEELKQRAESRTAEIAAMRAAIDEKKKRLTDPSAWIAEKRASLGVIRFDALRDWTRGRLELIKDEYASREDLDDMQALDAFDSDAEKLLAAARRFETILSEILDARFSLNVENVRPGMTDWLMRKIRENAGEDPRPEGLDREFSRILEQFRDEVEAFLEGKSEVEGLYRRFAASAVTAEELRHRTAALKKHPFADPQWAEQKLRSLHADLAGSEAWPDSESVGLADLFWGLRSALESGVVEPELLRSATEAFLGRLNAHTTALAADEAEAIEETWRDAFASFFRAREGASPELAEACANMEEWIPSPLQGPEHRVLQVIARFKVAVAAAGSDEAVPDSGELQRRAAAAQERGKGALADFWRQAAELRKSAAVGEAGGGLSRLVDESPLIAGARESDDRRQLELDLEGMTLRFKRLEGDGEEVFLTVAPLTIDEFFELYGLAGFDFEDLDPIYWDRYPRTFDFTGRGFSDRRVWDFGPNQSFDDVLQVFGPEAQVMHLVQPSLALRLADVLGLRLPTPGENAVLISQNASVSLPLAAIDLSKPSLLKMLRSESFNRSVYEKELKAAANSSSWKGGVAFEEIEQESNRFYDVSGGAAELAYKDGSFYASGSSWLLSRTEAGPSPLSEEEVYIDLGFRLAMDPPKRSAREEILGWIDLGGYLEK